MGDAFINLKSGEALLGDHGRYGMTEREYRSAKRRLERWGLARFQATSRGTIARLLDQGIYDINEAPQGQTGDEPRADGRRPEGERPTTNKKEKKEKNYPADSDESRLAQMLLDLIAERKADFRRSRPERPARPPDERIHRVPRAAGRRKLVFVGLARQGDPDYVLACAEFMRRRFEQLYGGRWITVRTPPQENDGLRARPASLHSPASSPHRS